MALIDPQNREHRLMKTSTGPGVSVLLARKNDRLYCLDFLRGIFALMVALLHYDGYFLSKSGYLAVDFFFILSGFVLVEAYEKTGVTFREFSIRRIARICPLSLISMIIILCAEVSDMAQQKLMFDFSNPDTLYGYFLSFSFLFGLGFQNPSSPALNAVTWSMSVELVVGLFVFLRIKQSGVGSTCILVAAAIVSYLVTYRSLGHLDGTTKPSPLYISYGLLRGIGGMMGGALIHHLVASLSAEWKSKSGVSVLVSAVETSSLVLVFVIVSVFKHSSADLVGVGASFALVMCFATRRGALGRALNNRWLAKLGSISFALYLFQLPVLRVLFGGFVASHLYAFWNLPYGSRTALFIGVLLVVSAAAHQWLEKPLYRHTHDKLAALFPHPNNGRPAVEATAGVR